MCINTFQIKNEIEKFKDQGIELEEQRKVILKQLEEKEASASHDADEYEQKYKEVAKILDQLKAGIATHKNQNSIKNNYLHIFPDCFLSLVKIQEYEEITISKHDMIVKSRYLTSKQYETWGGLWPLT